MTMGKVTDIPMGSYNMLIVLTEKNVEFPINLAYITFMGKVNTDTLEYLKMGDKGYKECTWPTINDLIEDGKAVRKPYGKEYDIDVRGFNGCRSVNPSNVPNFRKIQKEFKDNGFNVTIEALEHNFSAWLGDLKSGYRDEENGYHLFTPCGCNPLSFRASELHPQFEDWQITYEA